MQRPVTPPPPTTVFLFWDPGFGSRFQAARVLFHMFSLLQKRTRGHFLDTFFPA